MPLLLSLLPKFHSVFLLVFVINFFSFCPSHKILVTPLPLGKITVKNRHILRGDSFRRDFIRGRFYPEENFVNGELCGKGLNPGLQWFDGINRIVHPLDLIVSAKCRVFLLHRLCTSPLPSISIDPSTGLTGHRET